MQYYRENNTSISSFSSISKDQMPYKLRTYVPIIYFKKNKSL